MRNICLFRFKSSAETFPLDPSRFSRGPAWWSGGSRAISPDDRCRHPALGSLAGNLASPSCLRSVSCAARLARATLQPKEFPEGPSFVSAPQHRFVFGRAVGIVAEDAGEVVGGIDRQPRQQDQTNGTSTIARSMERPQPVSTRWVGCGPGLLAAWCPCRSARGFPGPGSLRNVGFPHSTQTFSASGHQPAGD